MFDTRTAVRLESGQVEGYQDPADQGLAAQRSRLCQVAHDGTEKNQWGQRRHEQNQRGMLA
ncbi:CIC11C00000005146 [Sungouiella intermedia]|uniref:CIC11C00000005146 n=1 Tax=Sungouiella intermedia TaxID=45354 RepID=A0A1L0BHS1_9ASCO|nr:CIC11C00000005146 [[Candida] intermedia]